MTGAVTLSTQAQGDFKRITQELANLQHQIATGAKAQDLQGYGGASSRILSARNLKASADARESLIAQIDARFGVQAAALGRAADASNQLALTIREALANNDGRGITTALEFAFSSVASALNETWNGQPLFAGERQGGPPVKIDTLDQLLAAPVPSDWFDEAQRRQTVNLGPGTPIDLAPKASEVSQGLFNTLRDLKSLLDGAGGSIGQPITASQFTQLLAIAERLEGEAKAFTIEEARTGELQKRLEDERARLKVRSDLLVKEIGEQADADLAEVSVRLNTLMVQYQAAAKSFADLSKLTLLDYL